jgi:short-subunit dehydrogenase
MSMPSVIVITGASSGIGAALANAYARPGTTLGLMGRHIERLKSVADNCTDKGAVVQAGVADVRDADAMNEWLTRFDSAHSIDLLIANAGVSAGLGKEGETPEQLRTVLEVNFDGVLNTVLPVLPRMRARKRGQIALMSSLAGLRGIPSCPAYSASKNAVRALGEGWRGLLREDNIKVSVICPGYIHTPMTEVNTFPMPFIISVERAADIIIRGLARNKARIAFPLTLYLPLLFLGALPLWLTDPFFAALPRKTVMEKP